MKNIKKNYSFKLNAKEKTFMDLINEPKKR